MLAARACSREEDSPEIDGTNHLIQETAESDDLIKPQFKAFWDSRLIYHDKLLTG